MPDSCFPCSLADPRLPAVPSAMGDLEAFRSARLARAKTHQHMLAEADKLVQQAMELLLAVEEDDLRGPGRWVESTDYQANLVLVRQQLGRVLDQDYMEGELPPDYKGLTAVREPIGLPSGIPLDVPFFLATKPCSPRIPTAFRPS